MLVSTSSAAEHGTYVRTYTLMGGVAMCFVGVIYWFSHTYVCSRVVFFGLAIRSELGAPCQLL